MKVLAERSRNMERFFFVQVHKDRVKSFEVHKISVAEHNIVKILIYLASYLGFRISIIDVARD